MLDEKNLLIIAKKDLRASEMLYNNNFYPQAIFYLQQSLEKTIKSFSLKSGILKKSQVKKYSHKSIDIFRKILRDEINSNNINTLITNIPSLKKTKLINEFNVSELIENQNKLRSFLDRLFNLQNIDKELIDITEDELVFVMKEINNIQNEFKKIIIQINNQNIKINYLEMENELLKVEKKIKESKNIKNSESIIENYFKEIDKNITESDFKKITKKIINLLYISCSLFLLTCVFSFNHAELTRYPTKKRNPTTLYDNNYSLVKQYFNLKNILQKVIKKIEDTL